MRDSGVLAAIIVATLWTAWGWASAWTEHQCEFARMTNQGGNPPAKALGAPCICAPKGSKQANNASDALPDCDWPEMTSNELLVAVGIATFFAILWQANETRRSAAAAAQSAKLTSESIILTHRPKIVVRNVVVEDIETRVPKGGTLEDIIRAAIRNNGSSEFTGYYHIANVGNTTAIISAIDELLFIAVKLPLRRPYDTGIPGRDPGITLAAGESKKIDFTGEISPEDQRLAVSGDGDVYVAGLIIYIDALGHQRQTAFCRSLHAFSRRFEPVRDTDYEYAD